MGMAESKSTTNKKKVTVKGAYAMKTHAYFHGVKSNFQVAPLCSVMGVFHQFLSKEGRTETCTVALLT